MKNYFNIYCAGFLCLLLGITGSCTTDDLDPSLEQSKESINAISTVGDMEGLVRGAYNRFSSAGYYGRDYLVTNEVRTPNVFANGSSGRFTTEAAFNYLPNSTYMWDNAYSVIAIANILIATDVSVLDGDLDLAEHIQGQAYAIRALAHYDLLVTYGQQNVDGDLGIPYVTTFKEGDDFPAREPIESNVDSILADLQMGFDLMSSEYYDSTKEFLSKYSAKAIESRVAIQFERWESARDAADEVISSEIYSVVPADGYVASFDVDGSVNAIFEIAQSTTDYPGSDRIDFIYRGATYGDIEVIPGVMDIYDEDDIRLDILGYEGEMLRNLGKYPNIGANIPVIRYEEVILNYAEALFQLGETGEALTWLNTIPESRNAEPYSSINIANILSERRKEFIFEGLYYWDLMRYDMDIEKVSPLQNILETIPYGNYRLAYPIPLNEIDANSNVVQNRGYGS